MPDGRIQRIDEDRQLAYIVRRGRTYAAPLSEVEAKARVASAHIHFDMVRNEGSEAASNVRLRNGTRSSSRHRRFADLTGAKRPGSKVETIAARSYGVDVTTQPFRVAKVWLQTMNDQDFDGATSLYLPGARLHTTDGSKGGRNHIRAELERSELAGIDAEAGQLHGVDRYVKIECSNGDNHHTSYLIIERGRIVEQWIDVEPDVSDGGDKTDTVEVISRGDVGEAQAGYAKHKLEHLIEHTKQPVRFARVKLTMADNLSIDEPAMVEATLELENLLVRAHSTSATFTLATDSVMKRLEAQIQTNRDRQRHRPAARDALPGTWRHGNLARTTKPYFDRPEDEREIVRHKSYAGDEMTIDEAAWDMAILDYDFFLFVELGSGIDSLIERSEDESLIVHHLEPGVTALSPTATSFKPSKTHAPDLAVSEAVELLNASSDVMLFFRNNSTARGNVIYRRYDGHYGLITPPTSE